MRLRNVIRKEEEGSIYREYYKVMIECAMRYIYTSVREGKC